MTKDAIYLSGIVKIMGYLSDGGSLEPLLVGKIALEQVPLIEELMGSGGPPRTPGETALDGATDLRGTPFDRP